MKKRTDERYDVLSSAYRNHLIKNGEHDKDGNTNEVVSFIHINSIKK